MAKLRLTLACWNYDRTRALLEERIPVDGIELNYLNLVVEETFFRMLRHREFDVAEMSLSSYTISLFREDPPFIAIPVFPSRSFRHSCIYINADSGIREPKDLIGKRIGNPEYQMTAPVWIRGILSDEYGVPVTSATYFQGGEEEPGRPEKLPLKLPPEIQVRPIPLDRTLAKMIASGEIDAQESCPETKWRPRDSERFPPATTDHQLSCPGTAPVVDRFHPYTTWGSQWPGRRPRPRSNPNPAGQRPTVLSISRTQSLPAGLLQLSLMHQRTSCPSYSLIFSLLTSRCTKPFRRDVREFLYFRRFRRRLRFTRLLRCRLLRGFTSCKVLGRWS